VATAGDLDRAGLERLQQSSLRLNARLALSTPRDAERFLNDVGIALRYQATRGLPIASLRSAAGPADDSNALMHAIALTNHLLGHAIAVEVNVIAGRLVLVHRSLMPALYALVRRGRPIDDLGGLDMTSRSAIALIKARREISVGDLRQHLGVKTKKRPDAADDALGALQRCLLVDRGPFEPPKRGIPYLSKEGYPYHFFHAAHPDMVQAAKRLSPAKAADTLIAAYLRGAIFATPKKLASLFRVFLSSAEITKSLERLTASETVTMQKVGKDVLAIAAASR
jgi:hypothetical protein